MLRYSRPIPFLEHLLHSRFKIRADERLVTIRSSTFVAVNFWELFLTFVTEDTFIIEQDPLFYQLMKLQEFIRVILHNFLSFTGMSKMFIAL